MPLVARTRPCRGAAHPLTAAVRAGPGGDRLSRRRVPSPARGQSRGPAGRPRPGPLASAVPARSCAGFFYAPLARRTSVRGRTVAVLLAGAAGTALLGVVSGPAVAPVAIAVLLGVARGIFLLLHATAVSDRWGTADYGHLSGLCQP